MAKLSNESGIAIAIAALVLTSSLAAGPLTQPSAVETQRPASTLPAGAAARRTPTTREVAAAEAIAKAKATSAALNQVAATLAREYEEHHKQPDTAKLRGQNDYFVQNPALAEGMGAEAVATWLGRPVPRGMTVDCYCYIQWQVLPAIGARPTGKLLQMVQSLYVAAPKPLLRPGVDPQDQRQLDQAIAGDAGANRGLGPQLNQKWDAKVAPVLAANDLILKYRTALYLQLPHGADTFRLGFEEAYDRAKRGLDAQDLISVMALNIRAWALSDPPAADLRAVADIVNRFNKVAQASPPPAYYITLQWDNNENRWSWAQGRAQVDSRQEMVTLEDLLKERVASPGGPIKFRD